MKSPVKDVKQFRVRMPEDLHGYIREQAEYNCRSMNAEIIFRLFQTKESDSKNEQQDEQ